MKEYLFRIWKGDELYFSYYVFAEDRKTAILKAMDCLGDKNELNMERLYHAEIVNELTGGNGVLITCIPITRENNKYCLSLS